MTKLRLIIMVGFGYWFFILTASAADNDWEYKAELYGYFPSIEATLPTDDEIELSVDDIFDNLDFTFLGVFQARKDDWAFIADLTYLKLSFDKGGNTVVDPKPGNSLMIPTRVDLDVEMKGKVLNLASSYRIRQTDTYDVQLLAGVRYLALDVDVMLDSSLIPGEKVIDGNDDVFDAIIGIRGQADLSDKWWLSYRFDIGTGQSDLTSMAAVQIGHKYDWGTLALGYRYMHYDFNSDFDLLKDAEWHGPLIGAVWDF